ncbi:MAG: hypothetical protein P9C36_12330 [Defluviicoccus sp.]|nr:hypothetical protein [Defluviicoccus sp.]MDG4593401.1 hypothetical protein [Defluviicoccus sp.]
MPHPVDPGAGAIDTALMRLQRAVGQLEEAADRAALSLASADEEHRSEAAGAPMQTEAVAAVLARLNETVARLRAVVDEDADA